MIEKTKVVFAFPSAAALASSAYVAGYPTSTLHSRKHDYEVQLYAFDILAVGGDDLRVLPLQLQDAAETWFEENDPEGVAFEYEVLE